MTQRKVLREVARRLVDRFHPERIILFGSRARGAADRHSDFDLMVVLPIHGNRLRLESRMSRELDGMGIARDVVALTPREFQRDRRIVGTIARPADKEGKVLYERSAQ